MKKTKDDDGWRSFISLCIKCKTPEELDKALNLFLTFEEREDIAKRYLIVKELLQGEKTQREMAETLKVSIAKITRGSNSLKNLDERSRDFLMKKIK